MIILVIYRKVVDVVGPTGSWTLYHQYLDVETTWLKQQVLDAVQERICLMLMYRCTKNEVFYYGFLQ